MTRSTCHFYLLFANLFDQNLEGCQKGVGMNISLFMSNDVAVVVVFWLPFF